MNTYTERIGEWDVEYKRWDNGWHALAVVRTSRGCVRESWSAPTLAAARNGAHRKWSVPWTEHPW